MAFIEKQKHGGITYYYLAQSIRVSPTKVKKVRRYLGKTLPSGKKIKELTTQLSQGRTSTNIKQEVNIPVQITPETKPRAQELKTPLKEHKESTPKLPVPCVIENVSPGMDEGRFPAKSVIGKAFRVEADVFSHGHTVLQAVLLHRRKGDKEWKEERMEIVENDRWKGVFTPEEIGAYEYAVNAWEDEFRSWQKLLGKKWTLKQDVVIEINVGILMIEEAMNAVEGVVQRQLRSWAKQIRKENGGKAVTLALSDALAKNMSAYSRKRVTQSPVIELWVESKEAEFSTWYELFPRSTSDDGTHGTFKDVEKRLPLLKHMHFNVLYLPPIHPIGETNRKGKNNTLPCEPGEPGSPWAIGSHLGGHTAIHPQLGTLKDFDSLVRKAREQGIEVALDMAFQCSADHPYIKQHPKWFKWRPDGSIHHAENPPKKYEDIVPFDFDSEDWKALWEELKNIVLFWIEKGVRIFRVDNPHTKPFPFWEWLIRTIKKTHPETIFLAEAFTRPKVMHRLAKAGFTQSYTYFSWRNTKWELTEYVKELMRRPECDYFRPHFWPNTPDILAPILQKGGKPAFKIRLALAATLSSNYGVYGPAFELEEHLALPEKEEYQDSEKYEIKKWDWGPESGIREYMERINRIRVENKALQETFNARMLAINNDHILTFEKQETDGSNALLIAISLDPVNPQSGWMELPEWAKPGEGERMAVDELIHQRSVVWDGRSAFISLTPETPAQVLRIRGGLRVRRIPEEKRAALRKTLERDHSMKENQATSTALKQDIKGETSFDYYIS
ncbi:alpha-1,4-glucan--maltose-1-phosphate maltosyltransferase [Candidatus Micrarchaeota archaeon]|nr:alpha-1,4-glucan--maltose-1-phosphate maltosyltransferase [Candidatus Micrarchaeota archaeon]